MVVCLLYSARVGGFSEYVKFVVGDSMRVPLLAGCLVWECCVKALFSNVF